MLRHSHAQSALASPELLSLPALLSQHLSEPTRTEVAAMLVHEGALDHDPDDPWMAAAGAEFRKRLDAMAWPRGAPWERPLKPGHMDFWRIHTFALDRLEELLAILLPNGAQGETRRGVLAWQGSHTERPFVVDVCLFTGAWDEPESGRGGSDLISLVAHLSGLGQGQAARWLADWTGTTEGRRYG